MDSECLNYRRQNEIVCEVFESRLKLNGSSYVKLAKNAHTDAKTPAQDLTIVSSSNEINEEGSLYVDFVGRLCR